ncbi:hypothetical protein NN3_21680 [Nocardia neocaledoniensis NBRC 108232]|uniref:Uncharacterized protein n=1 Tax=Nocardia neocaledoniensis TaxID=236511 RepID=A0A317NC70_9NOCA|nr:hypothetical protein [Nocardia neocaledoniensis]PWV72789.1 hypothetical protein DFR69_108101 [Nocardia neocaledoniensis]GEM31161.1 hypothetical protein NN3_21680 [Nocardia neocaledoniensis NBRC 108232]
MMVRTIRSYAADRFIAIMPGEIEYSEETGYTIDGMDPFEWVDAMAAD